MSDSIATSSILFESCVGVASSGSGLAKFSSKIVAHSRAFPITENKSGRLVINLLSISKVVSRSGICTILPPIPGKSIERSKTDFPTIVSKNFSSQISSRIIIPAATSLTSPISLSPQIIPREIIPAIFRSPITKSSPKTAPTVATGTYLALTIFSAPVKILSSPSFSPKNTLTIESFFESGCFSHESTLPITILSKSCVKISSISAV